jgi:hypothetical protein
MNIEPVFEELHAGTDGFQYNGNERLESEDHRKIKAMLKRKEKRMKMITSST